MEPESVDLKEPRILIGDRLGENAFIHLGWFCAECEGLVLIPAAGVSVEYG